MISCILLAAGTSSRMEKENKLLLKLHGKEILVHTLDALSKSNVDEITLVMGYQADKIIELIESNQYRIKSVYNEDYSLGMTSSIKKGVEKISPQATGIMISLGDMPFIKTEDYNLLIDQFYLSFEKSKETIVVPYFNQNRANPVIFSAVYKKLISKHTEPEGCRKLIDKFSKNVKKVNIETEFNILDIDTLEEFQQAKKEQI